MSQNPKYEVSSSKNEKSGPVEFLQKSFKSRKSMKFTKGILGASFETAVIRSTVRRFCSFFILKVTLLQSTKSQEVSGYLFYLKNLAIAC